jgi:hypothetical protein
MHASVLLSSEGIFNQLQRYQLISQFNKSLQRIVVFCRTATILFYGHQDVDFRGEFRQTAMILSVLDLV